MSREPSCSCARRQRISSPGRSFRSTGVIWPREWRRGWPAHRSRKRRVTHPSPKQCAHAAIAKEAPTPIVKAVRHLEAGEWQAAHALVQKDATPLGCWAHGLVHLIEGDLENAKYWYRRAHRPLAARQYRGRRDRRAEGDGPARDAVNPSRRAMRRGAGHPVPKSRSRAIPDDERVWVPQAPDVWFRPLLLNTVTRRLVQPAARAQKSACCSGTAIRWPSSAT